VVKAGATTPNRRSLPSWLRRQRRVTWAVGGSIAALLSALLLWRGMDAQVRWDQLDRAVVRATAAPAGLTFEVADADVGHRVALRLLGVTDADAACGEWLRGLGEVELVLSFDEALRRDEDAALLAYAYLPDGRMLNEALIEEGLARADRARSHLLAEWFGRVEDLARRRKRGMWEE